MLFNLAAISLAVESNFVQFCITLFGYLWAENYRWHAMAYCTNFLQFRRTKAAERGQNEGPRIEFHNHVVWRYLIRKFNLKQCHRHPRNSDQQVPRDPICAHLKHVHVNVSLFYHTHMTTTPRLEIFFLSWDLFDLMSCISVFIKQIHNSTIETQKQVVSQSSMSVITGH